MFDITCNECRHRQLIFPSQIRSVVNTSHGIEVHFRCWCGADQTWLTGRRRTPRPSVAA